MIAVENTDPKRRSHVPWRGATEKLLEPAKGRGQASKVGKSPSSSQGEAEGPSKRLRIPGLSNFSGI